MIRLPKTFHMFDDEVVLYVDKYVGNNRLAVMAEYQGGTLWSPFS